MAQDLTLRVAGLGHNLILEVSSLSTLKDLKLEIESRTSLPVGYQRLIGRGMKNLDNDEVTLESLDIQDRTKLLLLHNKNYAIDKEGLEAINELQKEIDQLSANIDAEKPEVVRELVTRICCKLDGIDTQGSNTLRALRKEAIRKAESLDKLLPS
eukprot:CAMPEP_0178896900 /NCGR_PEP_ID=MMETSP0786-20121207/1443_1 /TAXON_ID=186022 /ORGANISM="Thalassionema frauenfeldii, Strain CCMP 1798" /LENGTH=154 /DNA_ID=CAMNT_0020567381 /DNA_START=58 /DNA_END=519 /DNA_ORIENTATION=-